LTRRRWLQSKTNGATPTGVGDDVIEKLAAVVVVHVRGIDIVAQLAALNEKPRGTADVKEEKIKRAIADDIAFLPLTPSGSLMGVNVHDGSRIPR